MKVWVLHTEDRKGDEMQDSVHASLEGAHKELARWIGMILNYEFMGVKEADRRKDLEYTQIRAALRSGNIDEAGRLLVEDHGGFYENWLYTLRQRQVLK